MIRSFLLSCSIIVIAIASCDAAVQPNALNRQKSLQDTCDNPDADPGCAFVSIPSQLNHIMLLSEKGEKGERLVVKGQLKDASGRPLSNIFMYAYQTDITGRYTKNGNEKGIQRFHGRLHGWGKTNSNGEYEIHTIKPAPYPGGRAAAHIHVILKPNKDARAFYINDIVFSDDPNVNDDYRNNERSPGGSGIITLKNNNGVLEGRRDIVLTR